MVMNRKKSTQHANQQTTNSKNEILLFGIMTFEREKRNFAHQQIATHATQTQQQNSNDFVL